MSNKFAITPIPVWFLLWCLHEKYSSSIKLRFYVRHALLNSFPPLNINFKPHCTTAVLFFRYSCNRCFSLCIKWELLPMLHILHVFWSTSACLKKSCTKPGERCTKNFIIASSECLDSLDSMSAEVEDCKFEKEKNNSSCYFRKKWGYVLHWSTCSHAQLLLTLQ